MAQIPLILLAAVVASARGFYLKDSGCQIEVNKDLPDPQPLFLQPDGAFDVTGFLQPDKRGVIRLEGGQALVLACPGDGNYLPRVAGGPSEVLVTCAAGTTVLVDGDEAYDVADLACVFFPSHQAVDTGKKCYGDNMAIQIGFNVSRGFYKTIDVCFDQKELGPIFSHSTVVAGIAGYQTGVSRPEFKAAGFYGDVSPDHQFKRATQIETIGELLGSASLGHKYISKTSDYFLARGHLTAKADFVFGSEHRSTFYYVNVAPQWQTFNGANWATIEKDVRDKASDLGVDLELYTGTHGVATLPDVAGKDTPLYLDTDKLMPVPQFYWKIAYLPKESAAVAFVGINNPYVKISEHPELVLCPDVCDKIDWVTWHPHDVKKGEGYCCEVAALREKVASLPDITVTKLLT